MHEAYEHGPRPILAHFAVSSIVVTCSGQMWDFNSAVVCFLEYTTYYFCLLFIYSLISFLPIPFLVESKSCAYSLERNPELLPEQLLSQTLR